MITYRSFLDRLRDLNLSRQSKDSDDFNFKAATRCVEAAQAIIGLVPDEFNAEDIMRPGALVVGLALARAIDFGPNPLPIFSGVSCS